ncbi:MAG: FKBP-type peptidyl-prolyl cis-trans isomerase [Parabacteroides sp.]|nr:FKBP-type peptidyl-prolyl cis-trans isomerase [Parabacteroides sp.]
MSVVFTSCKDDDNDDGIDEAWKAENEAAFQAKANDPDFTQISVPGAGEYYIYAKKLKEGNGLPIYYNSRVAVYYKGWYINSKEGEYFDKREFEDGAPAKFAVSNSSANYNQYSNPNGFSAPVLGWTIALQNMVVGDRWEVWIPQQLAYGVGGWKEIPGNSTLIFEIEVVERVAEVGTTSDSQTTL